MAADVLNSHPGLPRLGLGIKTAPPIVPGSWVELFDPIHNGHPGSWNRHMTLILTWCLTAGRLRSNKIKGVPGERNRYSTKRSGSLRCPHFAASRFEVDYRGITYR